MSRNLFLEKKQNKPRYSSDSETAMVENAILTLGRIARSSREGANAVKSTGVLDLIDTPVEWSNAATWHGLRQLKRYLSRK